MPLHSLCFALAAGLVTASAAAQAPASTSAGRRVVGTIIVAHGADSAWNAYIEQAAREARTGGPVAVSFLMGAGAATHRFQDAAAALVREGATEIVVVPLLVSSHSGHYEQIRYLAGETDSLEAMMKEHLHHGGLARARVDVPIRVARALDDAPAMATILTARAKALATAPAAQGVFLVAHGPNGAEDYAAWMENLRRVADSVRVKGGFRDVRVDMVRDDAPAPVRREAVRRVRELIEMQATITGRPVVVVPVLISRGRVSRETFLADLAGLPVVYGGEPLLPHPAIRAWIERTVEDAVKNAA